MEFSNKLNREDQMSNKCKWEETRTENPRRHELVGGLMTIQLIHNDLTDCWLLSTDILEITTQLSPNLERSKIEAVNTVLKYVNQVRDDLQNIDKQQ